MYSGVQTSSASTGRNRSGQFGGGGVLNLARQLVGYNVKINRGGPDMVEGLLLAVNGEVLVVLSGNTVIYVNGIHVKSVTQISQGRTGGRTEGRTGRTGRTGMGGRSGTGIIMANTFAGVLRAMHQKFIQINRGGPEKLEGFLADTNNDFILLIVGREYVRIPIYHIRTVNLSGTGKSGGRSGSSDSGGKDKDKDKNDNKKRSGGDRGRKRQRR